MPRPRPSSTEVLRNGRVRGEARSRLRLWPGEGLMTEVIDQLAAAVNAHDLDAVAGLIHEDYRSEQPAHPGRAFAGRPRRGDRV